MLRKLLFKIILILTAFFVFFCFVFKHHQNFIFRDVKIVLMLGNLVSPRRGEERRCRGRMGRMGSCFRSIVYKIQQTELHHLLVISWLARQTCMENVLRNKWRPKITSRTSVRSMCLQTLESFRLLNSKIFTSRRKCRAAGRRRSCLASSETRCYSFEGFSKEPFPCFQCTGLIQFLRF